MNKKVNIIWMSVLLVIVFGGYFIFSKNVSELDTVTDIVIEYDMNGKTYQIPLSNQEFQQINTYLDKIKKVKPCDCEQLTEANLIINKKYKITIGQDNISEVYVIGTNNEWYQVQLPAGLYKAVMDIVNEDKTKREEKNNNKDIYVVVTDAKYLTMLNDGGSYTSIYYEFNFNDNVVKKYEDKYVGFKGYEYQEKLIDEKQMNDEQSKQIKEQLDILLNKEDIKEKDNYTHYTIKNNGKEKTIYNPESIESLKKIIEEINNPSIENDLLFTVQNNELKCITPVLKVYTDHYELGNKKESYSYDTTQLINDLQTNNVDCLNCGYNLEYNNQHYTLNKDFQALNDFLTNLNININVCETELSDN